MKYTVTGLGCENGWISVDDAVRPRVLLVAAHADDLSHVMDVARRLARRARVEVAVPNRRRLEAQVYSVGGVTVHRFMWRLGLAAWLAAYSHVYEAVQLHGAGRPLALALAGHRQVLRTTAADLPSVEDVAHEVFTRGVGLPA